MMMRFAVCNIDALLQTLIILSEHRNAKNDHLGIVCTEYSMCVELLRSEARVGLLFNCPNIKVNRGAQLPAKVQGRFPE
jgi:hypothetical protein